jgi:hypothetical protein
MPTEYMSLIDWSVILLVVLALVVSGALRMRSRGHGPHGSKPEMSGRRIPDSGKNGRDNAKTPRQTGSKYRDDYSIWVNILKEEKPNTHDFDLLGTRATVLWRDNDPEVSVVCITQFSNGTPKTIKYDHFEFNIKEWYWCATAPRGSADVIKKKFEELFRVPSGT